MHWRLVYCLFDRHRPKTASVRWDGIRHVGKCRFCGATIRKSSSGSWKRLNQPAPNREL